jgi:hypothetical protein
MLSLKRVFSGETAFESFFDLFDSVVLELQYRLTNDNSSPFSRLAVRDGSIFRDGRISNLRMTRTVEFVVLDLSTNSHSFLNLFELKLKTLSHHWTAIQQDALAIESHSQLEASKSSKKADQIAYYYFTRILVNRSYSLGKEVSEKVEILARKFNDSQTEKDLRDSMEALKHCIIYISDKLTASFESMKSPSKFLIDLLLPRIFECCEMYFHKKLASTIWDRYFSVCAQYNLDLKSYCKKRKEAVISSLKSDHSESPTDSLLRHSQVRGDFRKLDFSNSIACLDSLLEKYGKSAYDIMQGMLDFLNELKLESLEQSNGITELVAMDDIAPIFMYIFLQCENFQSHAYTVCKILSDSLTEECSVQSEGRTIALLEGVIRLILDEKGEIVPTTPPE